MWAHVINAAIGLWLMAAPSVLGYSGAALTNDRIVGPVIATFAVIAWWEVTRSTGHWNVPFGLWLVAAPWVLGYDSTAAIVNSMAAGGVVTALSFVRGTITQRFGGGWSSLFHDDPVHERAARRT